MGSRRGRDGMMDGRGSRRRNRGARSGQPDNVIFPKARLDGRRTSFVVCCVDDTDDLSGETSTGYVSEQIAARVATLGGRVIHGITRHQLLLAPEVPYTSHNSAMAFAALLPADAVERLEALAVRMLDRHSAPGSDPGLCIVSIAEELLEAPSEEMRSAIERHVHFGMKAKVAVCTKEEAYQIAAASRCVRLSEHGGTGAGVIGALAGAGLRLGGADGRFRGQWDLQRVLETRESTMEVGALREALTARVCGAVALMDAEGAEVREGVVALSAEAKPVFMRSRMTIMVEDEAGVWVPLKRNDLEDLGLQASSDACERFCLDNDVEECDKSLITSCRNCLYRRWTHNGMTCVA